MDFRLFATWVLRWNLSGEFHIVPYWLIPCELVHEMSSYFFENISSYENGYVRYAADILRHFYVDLKNNLYHYVTFQVLTAARMKMTLSSRMLRRVVSYKLTTFQRCLLSPSSGRPIAGQFLRDYTAQHPRRQSYPYATMLCLYCQHPITVYDYVS
jgi:hypothetical protein